MHWYEDSTKPKIENENEVKEACVLCFPYLLFTSLSLSQWLCGYVIFMPMVRMLPWCGWFPRVIFLSDSAFLTPKQKSLKELMTLSSNKHLDHNVLSLCIIILCLIFIDKEFNIFKPQEASIKLVPQEHLSLTLGFTFNIWVHIPLCLRPTIRSGICSLIISQRTNRRKTQNKPSTTPTPGLCSVPSFPVAHFILLEDK